MPPTPILQKSPEDVSVPLGYATAAPAAGPPFWPSSFWPWVLKLLGVICLPFAFIEAICVASAASNGQHKDLGGYCVLLVAYSFSPAWWLLYRVWAGHRTFLLTR